MTFWFIGQYLTTESRWSGQGISYQMDICREFIIMFPRNRVQKKNVLGKAMFGIRQQTPALKVLKLVTTAAKFCVAGGMGYAVSLS